MTKKQASSKVHVRQEAKVLGVHAVSRTDILLGRFTAQASRAQALVVGPVTPHNPCIFPAQYLWPKNKSHLGPPTIDTLKIFLIIPNGSPSMVKKVQIIYDL
jgi:hypothetical protein